MQSGPTNGLTSAQAAQRLELYGPNEPVSVRRSSTLILCLALFGNPLVLILLAASAISFSLHQRTDALIIAAIVLAPPAGEPVAASCP